jgi:hypothetical protein
MGFEICTANINMEEWAQYGLNLEKIWTKYGKMGTIYTLGLPNVSAKIANAELEFFRDSSSFWLLNMSSACLVNIPNKTCGLLMFTVHPQPFPELDSGNTSRKPYFFGR